MQNKTDLLHTSEKSQRLNENLTRYMQQKFQHNVKLDSRYLTILQDVIIRALPIIFHKILCVCKIEFHTRVKRELHQS